MTKITILGAGVMGSAFSVPLTDNGHTVNLVGTHLDGDIIEQIHENRVHPGLKISLSEAVHPYTFDRLDEAVDGTDLVVLGVNSLGVDWAAMMLDTLLGESLFPEVPMLFLTKGLEGKNDGNYWVSKNERLRILPDALREGLSPEYRDQIQMVAVGGPSIAGELAARRHTSVVLAGSDLGLIDRLAELMRTPYYHVWTSTDVVGIEVCVAMKNVYALAVGLAHGLLERDNEAGNRPTNDAAMHNPAAAIFAQGLWETSYLVEYMGGSQHSVLSMAGAGDLYVTCQGGRNSRMGRLLGLGMRYTDAKMQHMPDDTIEGAELALAIGRTVEWLVQQGELDSSRLPLLRMMSEIVCNDGIVDIPWNSFFGSDPNS
ncbi:MAG: glycerol-3-phosphate dehydrogenase [Chloroflexota bacterium]